MNSKDLCGDVKQKKPMYHSEFYRMEEDDRIMAISYQCKSPRKVMVFSSMHQDACVDADETKKPNIVRTNTCNACKTGVDITDSMLRMYSCKAATIRRQIL